MQNRDVVVKQLGLIPYATALAQQKDCHRQIVNQQQSNCESSKLGYLLFCEHFPVYTMGSSGSMDHLLVDQTTLQTQAIAFYKVQRGGGLTYHGPGQLVVYPIIDLERLYKDIHRYIRLLEASVMELLAFFHIPSICLPGLTGVWVKKDQGYEEEKICSIGINISRWVTMHGLALNINVNLEPFQQILPCGIAKQATSMQEILKKRISFKEVSTMLATILLKKFVANRCNQQ